MYDIVYHATSVPVVRWADMCVVVRGGGGGRGRNSKDEDGRPWHLGITTLEA